MIKKYLHLIVVFISVATIFSGLIQVVAPGFVLHLVGAQQSLTANHFFAIIGMFMTLFGGLMLQTVYSAAPSHAAVLWSALQKLGASVAVFIGIYKGIFVLLAGAVALFDLLSGVVLFYYLNTLKNEI